MKIGDGPELRRGEVIALLRVFEAMRTGHLRKIKAAQNRIELMPDVKTAYQPLYRAGPFARGIEKREVKKMLETGVIEPSMA